LHTEKQISDYVNCIASIGYKYVEFKENSFNHDDLPKGIEAGNFNVYDRWQHFHNNQSCRQVCPSMALLSC